MGWSDARGVFGNPDASNYYIYRKVMEDWHTFLPPSSRRYKIMCGDKLIGDKLTNEEADAMLKLLEASKD